MDNCYMKNCTGCNSNQPHLIYRINKRRGVKLRCCKCKHVDPKYSNVANLKILKRRLK